MCWKQGSSRSRYEIEGGQKLVLNVGEGTCNVNILRCRDIQSPLGVISESRFVKIDVARLRFSDSGGVGLLCMTE